MTDVQRDELLIALSKSVNNLQELMIDTKKELKADMNTMEERLDKKIEDLRVDMKAMEKGIRTDMKAMEERQDKKIEEIRADMKAMEERQNKKLETEMQGVAEIFHDTWNRNKKIV